MGKSSINGHFSIAMLNYQRVLGHASVHEVQSCGKPNKLWTPRTQKSVRTAARLQARFRLKYWWLEKSWIIQNISWLFQPSVFLLEPCPEYSEKSWWFQKTSGKCWLIMSPMDHLGMINTYSWDVVDLSSKKKHQNNKYPNKLSQLFFWCTKSQPKMSVATSTAHPPHLTSRGEPSARPSVFPNRSVTTNNGPLKQLQNWLAASLGTCSGWKYTIWLWLTVRHGKSQP